MLRLAAAVTAVVMVSLAIQESASAGGQTPCTGTYVTDADNVGNGGVGPADGEMDVSLENTFSQHPIEFNINVPGPTQGTTLAIKANSVDTFNPDTVSINGHYLGSLSGENSSWSESVFMVSSSYMVAGNNLIEIRIDNDDGNGMDVIKVGCGSLSLTSPPVGGVTQLSGVSSDGDGQLAYGFVVGAAALALAAAGAFALRRKQSRES